MALLLFLIKACLDFFKKLIMAILSKSRRYSCQNNRWKSFQEDKLAENQEDLYF